MIVDYIDDDGSIGVGQTCNFVFSIQNSRLVFGTYGSVGSFGDQGLDDRDGV